MLHLRQWDRDDILERRAREDRIAKVRTHCIIFGKQAELRDVSATHPQRVRQFAGDLDDRLSVRSRIHLAQQDDGGASQWFAREASQDTVEIECRLAH